MVQFRHGTIHEVVAYITLERRLLVLEHVRIPEAEVQIVQGTVKDGEELEDAVTREAGEETALEGLSLVSFRGREEAEICRDGSKERQRRFFYHLGLPPNGGGASKTTRRMALPP